MKSKSKKKSWFKVCPEKWLFGSTREEMTSAERGVWIDFLALAFMNDPPGQIDFFTYKRLANQLNISAKLLDSTIKKAVFYKKIDLKESQIQPDFSNRDEKSNTTYAKLETKSDTLETNRSKVGLPLRSIIILKWNEYQSEYLRQKPYRQRKSVEEEKIEDEENQGERLQNHNAKGVTQVTDRGEERRKDYIRGEESIDITPNINSNEPKSPLPSESKFFNDGKNGLLQEYLSRLGDCPGYPLDDYLDGGLFHYVEEEYPGIDILKELDKKIIWWEEHPDALKPSANPRIQLAEWFEKEHEFQNK